MSDALRVMGNPYNDATYRELGRAFSQHAEGVRTQVSFSPRESDEIVRALLLRTLTDVPLPDVAFMNGDLIRIFAERGLLSPIDRWLDAHGASSLRTIRVGASTYALSFGLSLPVVVYNTSLLQQAGIALEELPRHWSDVLAIAQAVRTRVPGSIGGFIEHDNGGAFTFLYLIQSFGLSAMTADEQSIGFDSPRGVEALDVLRGFGAAGQADADMSRRQARRAFATGRIGVLVTMSSIIPYLEQATAGHFRPVVAPLPLAHPGATVPAAGPVAVSFATEPKRQYDAWRFMAFAGGVTGQEILSATSGYLPIRDPPAPTQTTRQLSTFVSPDRVTSWYTFPGRNSLKLAEMIQDELQQVATLQITPEAALRSIVRDVESLLAGR